MGASGHATELAELGLRLALDGGRAGTVLRWAERGRAATLLLRPVRPPRRAGLARQVVALRRAVTDLETATLAGRATAVQHRRVAELETVVRTGARHATGSWGHLGSTDTVGVGEVRAALGPGRALVEYVELDGLLHAVVVSPAGPARLRRLGPSEGVHHQVGALRFGLRRLAHGFDPTGAAARSVQAAAAHLDAALVAPLAADLGRRDLVVVPTGALGPLPWSVLPSVAGRAVSVAPSAALWLRGVRAGPPGDGAVVLVAGPGLPGASAEVAGLARQHRGAQRLGGRRASVHAVSAALDGASLAHVAAHGRFRADNPLFSCLDLADGPLTVYDLEGLDRAPRLVVLSACDSALAEVGPGDELIGLASALFALGTTVLVATVVPVPDAATRRFMARFHHHLRRGWTPAAALSRARTDAAGRPELAVAAAGFLCLGAG